MTRRRKVNLKIFIKKRDEWYEAYLHHNPGVEYSYVMGKLDPDGTLVITDAWIDPELRGHGLGRRMVKALQKYVGTHREVVIQSGPAPAVAYAVLPEAQGFWESLEVPETQDLRKKRRLRRERLQYLEEEGSVDTTPPEIVRT